MFFGCSSLENINIDEDHPYLFSIDGVVYVLWGDQDEYGLFDFPKGRDGEFTVPGEVVRIFRDAFGGCGLNALLACLGHFIHVVILDEAHLPVVGI